MSLYHIGLSTTGHDPAFAIADEQGNIIFAEATERFLQDKRGWGANADHYNHLKPVIQQIIDNDPAAQFAIASSWSKINTDIPVSDEDRFIPAAFVHWMKSLHEQQQTKAGDTARYITHGRQVGELQRFDHHLCHAVNAIYSAPFAEASCLVLDGEGEVGAASLYQWRDGQIKRLWRSWGPGSLGTFYAWLTDLCGFSFIAGEEWKVMGLAASGTVNSAWFEQLCTLLTIENGRIQWADQAHLHSVLDHFKQHASFVGKPWQQAADLAATAQAAFCWYSNRLLNDIHQQTGSQHLILSGGCALNSAYNGTITQNTPFTAVHVPSAPADDGNAIGAAILSWQKHQTQTNAPLPYNKPGAYLGSRPNLNDLDALTRYAAPYQVKRCDNQGIDEIAALLAQGNIIGVMRGQAEFGPRALGNRSILADPRSPDMKARINAIVKGREAYRPFAPVIPQEKVADWFEQVQPSPYMSFTLPWKADKAPHVPAVVHDDNTGRLQTLSPDTTPWLYQLTLAFEQLTDVPVLLNTSFNVMGKPIVHSITDALAVLMTTGLDAVLIDDVLITPVESSYNVGDGN